MYLDLGCGFGLKEFEILRKIVHSPCLPCFCMPLKGEPFGWTENEERRKGSIFGFSSFFPQLPIAIATQPYDRVLCLDLVGEMSTPSSTPMNNEVINPFAYNRAVGTGGQGGQSPPQFWQEYKQNS